MDVFDVIFAFEDVKSNVPDAGISDNPNDCDTNLGSENNWIYGTWTPNVAYSNEPSRYNVSVYLKSIKNFLILLLTIYFKSLICLLLIKYLKLIRFEILIRFLL